MINYSDKIKKVLNEQYEQRLSRPVRAIELPCKQNHKYREPVVVQLERTGDQKVVCPMCGKEHYITWSAVQDNIRFRP